MKSACRAAVFAALVVAPLHAQENPWTTHAEISAEFARLLLHAGSATFRPGALPGRIPGEEALAANMRVVGSAIDDAHITSVALAVSQPITAVRAWFEPRLRAAGWAEHPPHHMLGRGFVPAYTQEEHGYCWPATDAQLSVRYHPAPRGGSYIVLGYVAPAENRTCAAPRVDPNPVNSMQRMMPTLRPPDGTTWLGGGGGGGGGNEYEMRSQLKAEHTPAEMLAHFGPQLREQGWTLLDEARSNSMSVRHAQKQLDNGSTVLLWVSVYRVPGDRLSLIMRAVLANDAAGR